MVANPAGFWRRFFAGILDGIIISVPLSFLFGLFLNEQNASTAASIMELLYAILIPVIWSGYTIGKRILGVRIVKVNGDSVSLGTMFVRAVIGALIYIITLGIGLIISAFMVGTRKDKRSIHDLIAGTYVKLD